MSFGEYWGVRIGAIAMDFDLCTIKLDARHALESLCNNSLGLVDRQAGSWLKNPSISPSNQGFHDAVELLHSLIQVG